VKKNRCLNINILFGLSKKKKINNKLNCTYLKKNRLLYSLIISHADEKNENINMLSGVKKKL